MDIEIRRFPAGEKLISQGDAGTSAYVLEEGEVIIDVDGKEITSVSERGAVFGEMSTLLGRKRGASVTTTKDSSFYVIDDLLSFLRQNGDLSIQLLKLMAQRVDEMDSVVINKRKWWNFF
jgi:CRP-like cAMP-binding protein